MEIETFASRVSLRAPGRWRVMRAHPVVSLGEKSPAGDESFVPGGAGNVARNLADLNAATELLGVVGQDEAARQLKEVLQHDRIGCGGLLTCPDRVTSTKTRIIAQRQQLVRVDRESRLDVNEATTERLLAQLEEGLKTATGAHDENPTLALPCRTVFAAGRRSRSIRSINRKARS